MELSGSNMGATIILIAARARSISAIGLFCIYSGRQRPLDGTLAAALQAGAA